MRSCPFCAEEIQEKAIKCRYCGNTLKEQSATERLKIMEAKYKAENPNKPLPSIPLGYFVVMAVTFVAVAIGLFLFFGGLDDEVRASKSYHGSVPKMAGAQGTVGADTAIATTRRDYQAAVDAVVAKDDTGFRNLVMLGRVFIVQQRTRILVLERNLFKPSKVRVLDGPYADKVGWLAAEHIK